MSTIEGGDAAMRTSPMVTAAQLCDAIGQRLEGQLRAITGAHEGDDAVLGFAFMLWKNGEAPVHYSANCIDKELADRIMGVLAYLSEKADQHDRAAGSPLVVLPGGRE